MHKTASIMIEPLPSPARHRHRLRLATVVAILTLTSGCGSAHAHSGGSSPGASSPSPTAAAMSVTSSIADGTHLDAAVGWQAHVQSTQPVTAVVFLIDGRREWTEHNAPYFFNDDHFLLQPWLLSKGPHTLSIKATDSSGATSAATSHVTVTPAPPVPPALLATYQRTVTSSDYARSSGMAGYDANSLPPTGTWTIRFQKDHLIALGDPSNVSGENEAFAAEPTGDLTLAGPANWLTPPDLRGGLCEGSPVDHYHWSISGTALTISGGSNCPNRKALFDGRWKRR